MKMSAGWAAEFRNGWPGNEKLRFPKKNRNPHRFSGASRFDFFGKSGQRESLGRDQEGGLGAGRAGVGGEPAGMGEEGGDGGGRVVAEGPPEVAIATPASHTGRHLREFLSARTTAAAG